jgi:hypothetical protein
MQRSSTNPEEEVSKTHCSGAAALLPIDLPFDREAVHRAAIAAKAAAEAVLSRFAHQKRENHAQTST